MSSDSKAKSGKSSYSSNTIFSLAHGDDENPLPLTTEEIKADLRAEGIDPDASWAKAKKLLDASAGRLKLEEARRARLAASGATVVTKGVANETRESLIEQIKRFLALEPMTAVYARKWEEGDLDTLRSLRDKLASTSARNHANGNAG